MAVATKTALSSLFTNPKRRHRLGHYQLCYQQRYVIMKFQMHLIRLALITTSALGVWACSPVNDRAVFEFEHPHDDRGRVTLVAVTANPSVIEKARAELAKSPSQRTLHINGPIARGDGGHNVGWRWHFVPNEWDLAEISIEVCDGRPSYVEQNLEEWLRNVGRYCPWSSRIVRER